MLRTVPVRILQCTTYPIVDKIICGLGVPRPRDLPLTTPMRKTSAGRLWTVCEFWANAAVLCIYSENAEAEGKIIERQDGPSDSK